MVKKIAERLTRNRKGFLAIMAAVCILCFSAGYVVAAQPHMKAALKFLNNAKAQLQKAAHNKGGHRVKAISLVNKAINEVKKGIAAGK